MRPAARRSAKGSTRPSGLLVMTSVYPSASTIRTQTIWTLHNKDHDLRTVPQRPPRGLPRWHLVRLPAPAARRIGPLRVRTAAQLDPSGLTAGRPPTVPGVPLGMPRE